MTAGLLATAWAAELKYTDGFARPWPSVSTVALLPASFWCLAPAVKALPLGTAIAGIDLSKEPDPVHGW